MREFLGLVRWICWLLLASPAILAAMAWELATGDGRPGDWIADRMIARLERSV